MNDLDERLNLLRAAIARRREEHYTPRRAPRRHRLPSILKSGELPRPVISRDVQPKPQPLLTNLSEAQPKPHSDYRHNRPRGVIHFRRSTAPLTMAQEAEAVARIKAGQGARRISCELHVKRHRVEALRAKFKIAYRGRGVKMKPEVREQIISLLHAQRFSYREIGEQVGVCKRTVYLTNRAVEQ
jgi:hypothetical protein